MTVKLGNMNNSCIKKVLLASIVASSLIATSAIAELTIQSGENKVVSEASHVTDNFEQNIRFLSAEETLIVSKAFPGYIAPSPQDLAKVYKDNGVTFQFATIKGHLFGNIDGETIRDIDPKGESSFTLSLPNDFDASPINITETNPGLLVNDYGESINFARLSTLSSAECDSDTEECLGGYGGAGFLDAKSMSSMCLVYTSSKVDITGVIEEVEGIVSHYNISLTGKGWHWIIVRKKGDNLFINEIQPEKVDPVVIVS